MSITTPAIDAALAALHAASAAHGRVLVRKYAALGKRIGVDYAPEIETDLEVLAADSAVKVAERAYTKAIRKAGWK